MLFGVWQPENESVRIILGSVRQLIVIMLLQERITPEGVVFSFVKLYRRLSVQLSVEVHVLILINYLRSLSPLKLGGLILGIVVHV